MFLTHILLLKGNDWNLGKGFMVVPFMLTGVQFSLNQAIQYAVMGSIAPEEKHNLVFGLMGCANNIGGFTLITYLSGIIDDNKGTVLGYDSVEKTFLVICVVSFLLKISLAIWDSKRGLV